MASLNKTKVKQINKDNEMLSVSVNCQQRDSYFGTACVPRRGLMTGLWSDVFDVFRYQGQCRIPAHTWSILVSLRPPYTPSSSSLLSRCYYSCRIKHDRRIDATLSVTNTKGKQMKIVSEPVLKRPRIACINRRDAVATRSASRVQSLLYSLLHPALKLVPGFERHR